jgi:hypothetical protein
LPVESKAGIPGAVGGVQFPPPVLTPPEHWAFATVALVSRRKIKLEILAFVAKGFIFFPYVLFFDFVILRELAAGTSGYLPAGSDASCSEHPGVRDTNRRQGRTQFASRGKLQAEYTIWQPVLRFAQLCIALSFAASRSVSVGSHSPAWRPSYRSARILI